MNKVHLLGRLTRDPEIKEITKSNGGITHVTQFSLALNEKYTNSEGERVDVVTYIDCVAWDTGAEKIHEWYKKGQPIIVHGKLINNVYEKDGKTIRKVQLRVENFQNIPRTDPK